MLIVKNQHVHIFHERNKTLCNMEIEVSDAIEGKVEQITCPHCLRTLNYLKAVDQ